MEFEAIGRMEHLGSNQVVVAPKGLALMDLPPRVGRRDWCSAPQHMDYQTKL